MLAQSKASKIGNGPSKEAFAPSKADLERCPTRYPATYIPEGKRLTRVGENSACKLKINSTEIGNQPHINVGWPSAA
ncbi:hypothetical protein GCM10023346_26550 [Arthrobacter gyeryongensis]|uniref:Uncharacterized protein n=1 Tax=Arthrobacter gyeryongensis TaxID=1650592 RepID=A0ABP9SG46_9MICC